MTTSDEDTVPRIKPSRPPWVDFALSRVGTRETPGPKDTPFILECLVGVGIKGNLLKEETAWCAAFVHRALKESGVVGTGKANARSYLKWGVPLAGPIEGCIAVFSRPPNPTHGHVGFVVGVGPGAVYQILSGNQNNSVCVKSYPKERLLGFRWPSGISLPSRSM